jgi:hypothetical protein
MANNSNKEMTTNYSDVNVSHLNFTDLEDNQRSKGQKIAYIRYTDDSNNEVPLFIQFPWVYLGSGGIPRIGEFYTDDSQRGFVKVPLDQSIPEIKKFSELLQEIDEKTGSDEFKEKMFGSKASKYQLQPIFRLQQEDDGPKDPSKKDYGPKHPYMKLKIDTTFPDNKVKSIVFNSVPGINGKRVRTKVNGIVSIDDIAAQICFMCKFRAIGRPVKLWAQAANKKDPTYGLTFKMSKVEVEPPTKTNSNVKQYLESDEFLDSENDSETEKTIKMVEKSTNLSKIKSTVSKQAVVAEVESDSDEELDDNSDEEVQTVDKVQAKQVQVKHIEESDEESDDEEVKPVKKATKSPAKSAPKSKKANM